MGACFDRLRCEVFQNLFLSPMNTGFVRPAVATVLTVYGIETHANATERMIIINSCNSTYRLRYWNSVSPASVVSNTSCCNSTYRLRYWNTTIFNRYMHVFLSCNSTYRLRYWNFCCCSGWFLGYLSCNSTYRLRYWNSPGMLITNVRTSQRLQQYLPFTVLKQL